MLALDPTNQLTVGLDLYTIDQRHQQALVDTIVQKQLSQWQTSSFLASASVHSSLDGVRVFTYSQWYENFDYRVIAAPIELKEFFAPESLILKIFASQSQSDSVTVETGSRITHLAEFRMMPQNQSEMVERASAEIKTAMQNSPGLLSATFHRSTDGTRVFNYGQWESVEAFEAILKQPGFNPDKPYWEGIARNEFHLYKVVHTLIGMNS